MSSDSWARFLPPTRYPIYVSFLFLSDQITKRLPVYVFFPCEKKIGNLKTGLGNIRRLLLLLLSQFKRFEHCELLDHPDSRIYLSSTPTSKYCRNIFSSIKRFATLNILRRFNWLLKKTNSKPLCKRGDL